MRSRVLVAGMVLMLLFGGCGEVPPPTSTSTAAPLPATGTVAPASTVGATGTSAAVQATATFMRSPAPVPAVTSTRQATSPAPPATPTANPSPATALPSTDGAVQTVLDYWAAVNARDYGKAYRSWAENGAASGQTYDQFAAGFADTVQVTVQIGAYSRNGDFATVPVTLTAVSNVHGAPSADQVVQAYRGTYTLRAAAQGWSISGANVLQIGSPSLPPADTETAVSALRSYLQAVNSRQFGLAYTYWTDLGSATGQTFHEFHQGFLTTDEVRYRLGTPREGAAAGSLYTQVTAILAARQSDGHTVTYCATYTMRRANVPPFDQLGWRIYTGSAQVIPNVSLDSAQADSMLNTGCSQ